MKINLTPIELIDQLRAWFHPKDRVVTLSDDQWISSKRVAWETAVSKNLALPGLVGSWPMSSVQRSTGNVYDVSGQGRTLTYNGNPVFSVYGDFAPYIELDGTGDYLSRADETDLDILGTETIYAANTRGLTAGGWFWIDEVANFKGMIGKWDDVNQRSYLLLHDNNATTPGIFSIVSTNGAVTAATTGTITVTLNAWHSCVIRYVPSIGLTTFVNDLSTTTTAGVPASLFNSTTVFGVGLYISGGNLTLDGRASLCFLCANALSDDLILAKYYQERELFQ